MHTFSFDYVYD